MNNGKGLKTALALESEKLDVLLEKAAADYGLNLKEPQELTAAMLVVNTLLQLENMRLLFQIDQALNS